MYSLFWNAQLSTPRCTSLLGAATLRELYEALAAFDFSQPFVDHTGLGNLRVRSEPE
jgi:hypothetical protein